MLGHLVKPSIQALIHGLNRHYYSIAINYRKVSVSALVGFVCVILQNLNNFSPPDPNVIFQGSSGVKLVMPNVIIETVRK